MLEVLVLRSGELRGVVLRSDSLREPEPTMSPGSTATAPGRAPAVFFLLDGGMRESGNDVGTGSFSIARYTRCMAYEKGTVNTSQKHPRLPDLPGVTELKRHNLTTVNSSLSKCPSLSTSLRSQIYSK